MSSLLSPAPQTPRSKRRDWLGFVGALALIGGFMALVLGGALVGGWLAWPLLPRALWLRWPLEAPVIVASGLLILLALVVAMIVGSISLDVRRERRLSRPLHPEALPSLSLVEIGLLRELVKASRHERMSRRLHPPRPELARLRHWALVEVIFDRIVGESVYLARPDALELIDHELVRRERALEASLEVKAPGKRSRRSSLSA